MKKILILTSRYVFYKYNIILYYFYNIGFVAINIYITFALASFLWLILYWLQTVEKTQI